MRLKQVSISQYKNLTDFSLNFEGDSFIDIFVGKNASAVKHAWIYAQNVTNMPIYREIARKIRYAELWANQFFARGFGRRARLSGRAVRTGASGPGGPGFESRRRRKKSKKSKRPQMAQNGIRWVK